MMEIQNPKRRIVEDLKIRNKDNMNLIAGEYFGNRFTYAETFQMFDDYKKAFLQLDGQNESAVTICAPSTIASVNAMYGVFDADKIANMIGPGFLFAYPDRYTRDLGSTTVVIFDSFLNEEFVRRLHDAGVKNVIVTSVTDYMNPLVKKAAIDRGMVSGIDVIDQLSKAGALPGDMQFIRIPEFAETGAKIKESPVFSYRENKIAAYFLTGATTSVLPKGVKLYADGFTKMAQIYDHVWFDFEPGMRTTVFIPIFYATSAVHAVHAGLFRGMTLLYKPKYDRFAFATDLLETKCGICVVAPSHVAALEGAGLPDNALKHLQYVCMGGEALLPAQMDKFRKTAKRLGIQYMIHGYGMTETGSMTGISAQVPDSDSDVTFSPLPGIRYRIVDPETGKELPQGQRGILEMLSPCATAGYIDSEKDKKLFTKDGWIHTGDVAMQCGEDKYRVFGRDTDCFTRDGIKYAMFDIEEKVLEHEAVAEAEVVCLNDNDKEAPAIVVVLRDEYRGKEAELLKELTKTEAPGMEYLWGIKFIDRFKTNPITSKRDYLSLKKEMNGYYVVNDDKVYIRKNGILEECTEVVTVENTLA